ncbi:MAG: sulfurtransferase TusA family protein [Alphaproteobacteria bacterium]
MTTLDTKGLRCPLPVLKARRAMKDVRPGGLLTVLATDPSAVKDFQAFCETTGFALDGWQEKDGVFTFHIRKPA